VAEAAIAEAAERTRQLDGTGIPPGLRGLLAMAGARNLGGLVEQWQRLDYEATTQRHHWERARQRTRSLQKLVERIEAAQQAKRRRAAAAELLDVVSSIAVAES
jgi:hypothetical protein